MVFRVFYEASRTSARDHPHETDRVEACRPLGMLLCQCSREHKPQTKAHADDCSGPSQALDAPPGTWRLAIERGA